MGEPHPTPKPMVERSINTSGRANNAEMSNGWKVTIEKEL